MTFTWRQMLRLLFMASAAYTISERPIMNTELAIQLSEHTFAVLSSEASAAGKTPAELAAAVVESIYAGDRIACPDPEAARARFEQWFGSIDMGRPIGIDNEAIDADLAREYGNTGGKP
jgi:hypothetical protein